jgi:fucose permease
MNKALLALAYATMIAFGFVDNARGPAFPEIIDQLNLTNLQGSQMFALASLSALFVNLFGKKWLAWPGPMNSLRFWLFMQVIGCFGTGLAGSMQPAYPILIISSILLGAGSGGSSICISVLTVHASTPKTKRRALSGLHAMYGIASMAAPLLVGFAPNMGLLWGDVFKLISLIPLAILVASFSTTSFRASRAEITPAKIEAVPRKALMLIGGIFGFYVAAEIAVSSRLVIYVKEVWKYPLEKASLYLGLFFALLFIGRITFALKTFPGKSFNWLIFSATISLVFFTAGLYVHPLGLSLCGLTMSIFYPSAMDWMTERYHLHLNAMTSYVIVASGVTLILMHWSIGWITGIAGLQIAMLTGPVFLLLTLACLAGMRR